MTIQILESHQSVLASYFLGTAGKVTATVGLYRDGRVQVTVHNSSNRTWRGAGRFFPGIAEAMSGYKTSEVKAIIRAAQISTEPLPTIRH